MALSEDARERVPTRLVPIVDCGALADGDADGLDAGARSAALREHGGVAAWLAAEGSDQEDGWAYRHLLLRTRLR